MQTVSQHGGQYLRRIVEDEIDELLGGLSAISIEGPKAVGKTETALRRAGSLHNLDDPSQVEIFRASPEALVEGHPPIMIDEWQRLPYSWDLVRRSVDADPSPGRFILAGSSTPNELPAHSGAGRIVTVRMRPLSLAERQISTPSVRLADLLSGARAPIYGETSLNVHDYATEIVKSGFPAIRRSNGRLLRSQLDGYLDRIVKHDFVEAGHRIRDPQMLRSWLTAYAAASSTTASFETIRDASSAGQSGKPSKSATMPYRNILEQTWMLDPVPAWLPSQNLFNRLSRSPVHQLADPALAARLLRVGVDGLVERSTTGPSIVRHATLLGALFQSLVTLSVRTYAQANEASVYHLRTPGGRQEIDLIIERDDRRVVALEVKLTANVRDSDLKHLKWLQHKLGNDLLDAAVITTGKYAFRRRDGIAVIPAGLLTW